MNRRRLLRNLAMVSGGLVALPSWATPWEPDQFSLPHFFSFPEQLGIAAVADTIIPSAKEPGALDVGVEKFLVKLFEDCYEQDVQENIRLQLAALDEAATGKHQLLFKQCSHQQREALLLAMSQSPNKKEKEFFDLLKSETIRGYSTSKNVMVDYLKYKVVPGHYHGCVTVNS